MSLIGMIRLHRSSEPCKRLKDLRVWFSPPALAAGCMYMDL